MDFKLKIITPDGIYLEDEITRLDVKTLSGNIGVMARHVPIVSGLKIAKMAILKKDKKKEYALHGGILNVSKENVTIITEAIESKEEINIKRAEVAKKTAEKRISSDSLDKGAELTLKRAITRLKM